MARLRPRERLLLMVGLSVVAVLLLALLVFFPEVKRAALMQVNVARKQTELRQATALANQRVDIERQHAAAARAAESLLTRIPAGPDLPDLIARLDDAMAASGTGLVQISFLSDGAQPSPAPPAGSGLGSLPVQLRVRGTYPQVRTLVQTLEDSPRLVVVDRIALTGTETGVLAELGLRALFLR